MKLKYPKDLTGLKFGRLTPIEMVGYKHHHAIWRCVCDCGKEKIIQRSNLVSKGTESCGCIKKEQNAKGRKAYGYSAFRQVYNQYNLAAKRRGFSFNLSENEAKTIFKQNCYYCGKEPSTIAKKAKGGYGEFIYNGIDRVDSNGNYTLDNVVPCCSNCNWMKLDFSQEEFISHIRKIYENLFHWMPS